MRLFSIQEANSLLPSLRQYLKQLQELKADLRTAWGDLERRFGGASLARPYAESDPRITELSYQFDQYLEAIRKQGIICRSIDSGLFDFPALTRDRYIYLCWIANEDAISHWHEIHEGFPGRKAIAQGPFLEPQQALGLN